MVPFWSLLGTFFLQGLDLATLELIFSKTCFLIFPEESSRYIHPSTEPNYHRTIIFSWSHCAKVLGLVIISSYITQIYFHHLVLFHPAKQKELKVKDQDGEVLEECIGLLTDVKNTFVECVANSEFKKVKDIKPMEPFITKKAYSFLRDILLGEKEYFENNELGRLYLFSFLISVQN